MSRIPIFVEKSPRKNWNKKAETCIFIARESVKTSSEIDDDLVHDRAETVSNGSRSVSVVSCVKGVVNRSCNCVDCKEISEISTKTRTKDGVKKSFIPIKDSGMKSYGWTGSKLTPAKSILTPAPVKVKSKVKTKNKSGDDGVISPKVLAPAKSSQSPRRSFRSAFKVISNTETETPSKRHADKPSQDRTRKCDSRHMTSLDYEDSEPECFQHELKTRLPNDSPASVKGLKNYNWMKHEQKGDRLDTEKEIKNQSKSVLGSYDEHQGSQAHTEVTLQSKNQDLNSKELISGFSKHEQNSCGEEKLDESKNEHYDCKNGNQHNDNDNIFPQEEPVDNSISDQTLDEISSIHTTIVEKVSDSHHMETEVLEKDSNVNARSAIKSRVDDSGHVTCVISSPPSGRAAKVVNDHVTVENRLSTVGTVQKSSKLPLFYKRKLPKPPSEVRTVKYGQKVTQEIKENHLETCKKTKGIEGKVKKSVEAQTTKYAVQKQGL